MHSASGCAQDDVQFCCRANVVNAQSC
jgi:hypothetical protein